MRMLQRFQHRLSILSLSLLLGTAACAEDDAVTPGNNGGYKPPPANNGDGDTNTGGDGDTNPGGGDGDDMPSSMAQLIPWAEGNTWTYRVSKNGEVASKVTTVGALEPVGGIGPNKDKLAYKVTTTKGSKSETVSWQGIVGDLHVRYREQSFDAATNTLKVEDHWTPYKLRVDNSAARRVSNTTWTETHNETKQVPGMATTDTEVANLWLVDGEQSVTVPAGTFKAIVIRKTAEGSTKTYWFVPGIGKVKETGGQTEELESYKVAP